MKQVKDKVIVLCSLIMVDTADEFTSPRRGKLTTSRR